MSVHFIYRGNGGAKFMRPIHSREEYLSLRNGGEQRQLVERKKLVKLKKLSRILMRLKLTA
jgi:hypothetical protein